MSASASSEPAGAPRVVILGAGVAALECVIALRALAQDGVSIALVAPDQRYVHRPLSVSAPFTTQRRRGFDVAAIAAEFGVAHHRCSAVRVDREDAVIHTDSHEAIRYDDLVVAVGATPEAPWPGVLTFRDGRDAAAYRLALKRIAAGELRSLAIVVPAGNAWALPGYELALETAAFAREQGREDVALALLSPEQAPLEVFGPVASDAIATLLADHGVEFVGSAYAEPLPTGGLAVSPGGRHLEAELVVALPRLSGPRLRGLPCDSAGFLETDAHGRVRATTRIYAAGDATAFPLKQGGLAAQQADAVAETIAAAAGAPVQPAPFCPVLRGVLLTGGMPRYLRHDVSGTVGDNSDVAEHTMWWPPGKIAARYLGPYLSGEDDPLSGPVPSGGIPVERELETSLTERYGYAPARAEQAGELTDFRPSTGGHSE